MEVTQGRSRGREPNKLNEEGVAKEEGTARER